MPNAMPRIRGAAGRRFLAVSSLSLVFGCSGDNLAPPKPIGADVLYWELELSHHAVTLSTTAPYDTFTVKATPRNLHDEELTGLPAPVYTSTNTERVLVSSEGTLVALAPTSSPVVVLATLTTDNLKHVDTVRVKVVDNPTPPVLETFSIHPVAPDSAKRSAVATNAIANALLRPDEPGLFGGAERVVPVFANDTAGVPITGIVVSIRSSDTTIARFAFNRNRDLNRTVRPLRPGSVTFYASTAAFGVTKADTLLYRVGWPLASQVVVSPAPGDLPGSMFSQGGRFAGVEIRIGVGGIVMFFADSTDAETAVTFDKTAGVAGVEASSHMLDPDFLPFFCLWSVDGCSVGGNFVLSAGTFFEGSNGLLALRAFTEPGTYEFHDPRSGLGGRIIVIDER